MPGNKQGAEFITVSEIVDHRNAAGYAIMKALTESSKSGGSDEDFIRIGKAGGATMAIVIDGVEYSPKKFFAAYDRHYEAAVVEGARKILKEKLRLIISKLDGLDEAIEEALKDLPGYEQPERF